MSGHPIILDACCSLNLCATGCASEILQRLPYPFIIGERARREVLWLRVTESEEREPVDLEPLLASGLLTEVRLQNDREEALFVEFAAILEDGEAETAALAVSRGYALATDDRKARRVVLERESSQRLYSTLEILREWQEAGSIASTRLADVLERICYRASYRPGRFHPLWDWWHSLVGDL